MVRSDKVAVRSCRHGISLSTPGSARRRLRRLLWLRRRRRRRISTTASAAHSLGRQLNPLLIIAARRLGIEPSGQNTLGIMPSDTRRVGAVGVPDVGLRVGPARDCEPGGSGGRSFDIALLPLEAALAAEDEGEGGVVDGGGDLSEGGLAGVELGRSVLVGPAEGGEDLVIVGVGEEEEVVDHATAKGDAAPAGSCALGRCTSLVAVSFPPFSLNLFSSSELKIMWCKTYQKANEFSGVLLEGVGGKGEAVCNVGDAPRREGNAGLFVRVGSRVLGESKLGHFLQVRVARDSN